MKDWKDHLAELYKGYSTQQKNKKGITHKGDTIENFRGKKVGQKHFFEQGQKIGAN